MLTMQKRAVWMALVLYILIGGTASARGDTLSYQGFEYVRLSEHAAVIVHCWNQGAYIGVPDTINGIPVVGLGELAFTHHNDLAEIALPEGLLSIGSNAFFRCYSLTNCRIPGSVYRIDPDAFFRCEGLEQIDVEEDNQFFSSRDGVLFDRGGGALLIYPEGKRDASYTVPDSTWKIGLGAFGYDSCLSDLYVPATVEDVSGIDHSFPSGITLHVKPGSPAEYTASELNLNYVYY